MTAEKLSTRYDIGLEYDRLYEKALAEFRFLVVDPRTKLSTLRSFIDQRLPPDRPDYVKVLFLETVARLLGKEWTQDTCDFIDVTIATARLQELVTALSRDLRESARDMRGPHAIIMSPAGEQHTLMPHMLGLLFETLGWSARVIEPVDTQTPAFYRDLVDADIACIGWSNTRLAGEFRDLVHNVRLHRKERRLPLMVGGAAALDSVDFLVGLGIDCICDSVYSAVRICESFFDLDRTIQQPQAVAHQAAAAPSGIDWLTP